MSTLLVKLNTTTTEPSFVGHSIRAFFTTTVAIEGTAEPIQVPGSRTASVEADGNATLTLPARDTLVAGSSITLQVDAPDGETLAEATASLDAVDSENSVDINVDPKEFFPTVQNTDPAFGKPSRLRGLVVDPSGKNTLAGLQVVIFAQPTATDSADIVAVAQTDARGYFSAPYPLGNYVKAEGVVGAGNSVPLPIRLNADGTFPEQIILGIELPASTSVPCNGDVPRDPDAQDLVNSPSTYTSDLGTGNCVDFNKPNRVLEEFSSYTIVRTTEPLIKGLTLQELPKIDLDTILGFINPQLLGHFLGLASQEQKGYITKSLPTPALGGNSSSSMIGVRRTDIEPIEFMSSETVNKIRPDLDRLSGVMSLAALQEAKRTAPPNPETPDSGINFKQVKLQADIAKTMTRDPDGFSLMGLGTAEWLTRVNDFGHVLDLIKHPEPNRADLTYENPVDWDDEPTFYQACTIAHGHILHLKTEWVADGYSLGDLLYSLPLAPCQKKQIAILDWDRREAAARQETLQEQEFLAAQLSHDRDIYDIANGAAHGSVAGGSEASTWGVGGGFGVGLDLGFIGGSIGVGGGYSSSSSSAWQESSKSAAASSLQQIRDRVSQSALAVRNQRSTVVQTVRQGENLRVETEVVANHNHCHAVTIEYFEVLRHFLVRHRLADVQECLLVPLLMSRFDSAKARRWRDSLNRYLRNRRLGRGFDALQRIADNYVGSDMPTGAYAEEELEYLDGYLRIRFHIQRPRDNEDGSFLADAWPPIMAVFGVSPQEFYQNYLEGQRDKDQIFAEVLGPRIAEEIVNGLRFHAVLESGAERELPIDATLVSDFRNDEPLYISLRLTGELPTIRREEIKFIRVSCVITVTAISAGPLALASLLTPGSKVIVHSGQINYRTKHLAHSLFNQQRILNDLSVYDGVSIFTPLSQRELRRPREEDKEYASSLLKHLNDHIEYYHRVIWWHMDRQRRYMLLDGFIAPNSGGRSVASVVENRLVGIIGNCLVLPVARGYHLDPTYSQNADNPITLLEHYQPTTPIEPSRIAIPTKGVFAESVMGACNACEKKDESRFWRWEESPCPDQPTPIQEVSTASRRAEPPNLEAKDFPAPIVAFQNVPATPDPQGYGALLQMLSNPNLFPDVTGLTENQRNALATLQSALATSQYFGGKAADLALQSNMRQDIDKALNKINEQHQAGAITDEQRANLTEAALRSMIGGGTQTPAQPMTTDEIERLTNTAGANDADVTVSRPGGENVSVNAQQATLAEYNPPLQQQCGFFGLNTVVTETSLRDAIRFATFMEPLKWRDGTTGAVLKEDEDQQFGHLVRYWLARFEEIRPSTLTALQNKAIDPAINYGHILDPGPNNAQVVADVARVRVELLADAPGVSDPPNLNTRVEQALLSARASRKDETAWSAVFIVACIRGVAIQLGLEAEDGSNHVGQNMLLQAHEGHRFYVAEAYRRRLGPNGRTNGTYHAFQVNERAVQVGDIIVQDRDANTIANVVRFNNIPSIATSGRGLHCDIVIEVTADNVIAIGGNVLQSVRRRRYPLDANGHLIVNQNQLYAQEEDSGNLPNVPASTPTAGLGDYSTGRIFALLGPIEICGTLPGQQAGGGMQSI